MTFIEFIRWLGYLVLTQGQRALCSVGFDGVEPKALTAPEREIAAQLFGSVDTVPPVARLVFTVVGGARLGKSVLTALRVLHIGLTHPLDTLAPGEIAFGLIVCPDGRLSEQDFRYVLGAIDAKPELRSLVAARTATSVTLSRPDGKVIQIAALPATEAGKSLRGRSLFAVSFSESAFFRAEGAAVADTELFRAVLPRVLKGGQVVVSSTPWGEQGLLWELWRDNFGRPSTALVAHAPTLLLRSDEHTQSIVERERLRDPRNAEREFDARFGSTDESLLDSGDIDRAVDTGRFENQREPNARYALAVDLATRSDFSVALVAHRELVKRDDGPPVDSVIVDLARHWEPSRVGKLLKRRIEPDELEREIAAVANHFRTKVVADGWSFDFFESRMKARGIVSEQASMAPAEQARRASLLSTYFAQGRIRLPDGNPELLKQLKALRVIRSPGGHLRFAAPNRRGQHDDYPKALLLLVEAAQSLPVSGGSIGSEWRGNQRVWFAIDQHGHREPCLPPVGSTDWLDLCYRCSVNGTRIPSVDEWLSQPGNLDALERHVERRNAASRVSLILNR